MKIKKIKFNEKKFLIYLDILGFKNLPELIAGKFNEDAIREKFLSEPLMEKIDNITKAGVEWTKGISAIGGSDNYVLLIDNDINKLFKVIGELSMIKILHKDSIFIPLEIAVDIKEIDMQVNNPINQKEVIYFLKNDIINPYRKKYKERYGNQSELKETFILFTDAALTELKEHHKKDCIRYSYFEKNKNGEVRECFFNYLPFSIVERESKISNFFELINQSKSEYSGALIDKIFVPPDEFDKIKEKLEKDRIVFITGPTGYGKTYTAIRLLWEWYNSGYIPIWVPGKEAEHREKGREKLANIDALLKPKHVIYFEDPFGIRKYERRDDLKERINFIVNSVKNNENVYIIITSRKDIFQEFEKECYSSEQIKRFENELDILKPSYSYQKRKEILEKWAEAKGCEWLKNKRLKKIIFELLKSEIFLPTPLSIHDFSEATARIKAEIGLKQQLDVYSCAVDKAFADEIKGLYDSGRIDRVLFLSFIFIEDLELDFVKKEYETLKKEDFEDFNKILQKEYRVKVEKSQMKNEKILKFSHPLYSKALPYILDHSGCKNIFCKVLTELSKYNDVAFEVSIVITDNFNNLPEDIANSLLLKISESGNVLRTFIGDRNPITDFLAKNYNMLSEDLKYLLFNLSENYTAVEAVAKAVRFHFDELPEDVRNKLLLKLSLNYDPGWSFEEDIGRVIAKNINEFPKNIRNELIINSSKKGTSIWGVAWALVENSEKLNENLENLFYKLLHEWLQNVIEDYLNLNLKPIGSDEFLDEWFAKKASKLISNISVKIDKNFAVKALEKISREGDYEMRRMAQGLRNKYKSEVL